MKKNHHLVTVNSNYLNSWEKHFFFKRVKKKIYFTLFFNKIVILYEVLYKKKKKTGFFLYTSMKLINSIGLCVKDQTIKRKNKKKVKFNIL